MSLIDSIESVLSERANKLDVKSGVKMDKTYFEWISAISYIKRSQIKYENLSRNRYRYS